jgi:hypothetical protein
VLCSYVPFPEISDGHLDGSSKLNVVALGARVNLRVQWWTAVFQQLMTPSLVSDKPQQVRASTKYHGLVRWLAVLADDSAGGVTLYDCGIANSGSRVTLFLHSNQKEIMSQSKQYRALMIGRAADRVRAKTTARPRPAH